MQQTNVDVLMFTCFHPLGVNWHRHTHQHFYRPKKNADASSKPMPKVEFGIKPSNPSLPFPPIPPALLAFFPPPTLLYSWQASMISGARYQRVTTYSVNSLQPLSMSRARPKSHTYVVSNIVLGVRCRWICCHTQYSIHIHQTSCCPATLDGDVQEVFLHALRIRETSTQQKRQHRTSRPHTGTVHGVAETYYPAAVYKSKHCCI